MRLAGMIGLSLAFLVVAPLLALTIATALNLASGLLGLRMPEALTYALAWTVVILTGWRLLARAREARTPEGTVRTIVRPLAVLWLIGCGFLSLLFAAFASDSGSAEARDVSAWVLGIGLILAVAPLLIVETTRVLQKRKD